MRGFWWYLDTPREGVGANGEVVRRRDVSNDEGMGS